MSLSDYSDLEQDIINTPDMEILPAGTEVTLRIVVVSSGVSEKNDAGWKSVSFDVPSEPNCPMFNEFFWDLVDKDKILQGQNGLKQVEAAKRQYRDFGKCFGIEWGKPFSWEDDLPGKTGDAILKIVKDKSGEYPDKNGISRYIVGH